MNEPGTDGKMLQSAVFRSVDRHFASFIRRFSLKESGGLEPEPEVILAAAMVSRRLADGEVCLSLGDAADKTLSASFGDNTGGVPCPRLDAWLKVLRASPVVGVPGETKPLILDAAGRLYLHRYWNYEQAVAEDFRRRFAARPVGLDLERLSEGLKRLFPAGSAGAVNWQKVAAFAGVRQRFCTITGGPGTGKTWTVARMLVLLLEQPGGERLRVKLAAPTGKAVMRLRQSLRDSLESMPCDGRVRELLQHEKLTVTLHSLLGAVPDSVRFRHDEKNPLPVDLLVVDEASMISLSLMRRLVGALEPDARLVLVGDKDQLPPVDPGNVLGQVCMASAINRFSADFRKAYGACVSGSELSDSGSANEGEVLNGVVQLQTNHRAGEASLLHQLSLLVNEGATDQVVSLLGAAGQEGGVRGLPLPAANRLKDSLRPRVMEYYGAVIKARSPLEALGALEQFRILCAVREGPFGTIAVNRLVGEILAEAGMRGEDHGGLAYYTGKPILVTSNNYGVNLFNGDIGVAWRSGQSSVVHFPSGDGATRAVARERLPDHDPAFAMTVHKSQGSEFAHVLLILPETESPVLTRELLYTGLTRARTSLCVIASESVLRWAMGRQMIRTSGLSEALTRPDARI
jgi:exodeoxyribonuclease V alpha subunit